MKICKLKLFTVVYTAILAANFFWFISGGPPLETESPLRIILGSLLIFLLPGLVWGEFLGFRSNHLMVTIAISFAVTLTIEILLIPVLFLLRSTIELWVALIFFVCVSGIFFLNLKLKNGKEPEFINPLFSFFKQRATLNVSTTFILVILILISYGTYQWGEDLFDIAGEKLLHMIFVRYYYSMPMVLNDIGIHQGAPPLNLVNLWEYLIAGWASLINIDPLPLFYRVRFVIPVLGFSGMYLLIRNIFTNPVKAEAVFWGVLIMSTGWFVVLPPSSLDWLKNDPFRGVMSFMGTVHHSDAAMDILIALISGLVLLTLRNPDWRNILLLSGILAASFMWHARDFFQTAIYAGIFGITIFITPQVSRKLILKRWVTVMAVFLIVAIFFFAAMSTMIPEQSYDYDEFSIKKVALKYAFLPENLTGIRNLFNFPPTLLLSSIKDPNTFFTFLTRQELSSLFIKYWNYFLWLIISALTIPLLAFWGDKEERQLSLFYITLWFLALGWNFSMLMLIVMTYGEIHIITPRMLYIFSYIVVSVAAYRMLQLFNQKGSSLKGLFIYFALMLCMGSLSHLWWSTGILYVRTISIILSIIAMISFLALFLYRPSRTYFEMPYIFVGSILGLFLFFIPILGKGYIGNIQKIFKESRPDIKWFSDSNPLDISTKLIYFIKSLPKKKTLLVYPLGKAMTPIYGPHYVAVVPEIVKSVLSERDIYMKTRNGQHPLFIQNVSFIKDLKSHEIVELLNHNAIKNWLNRYAVDYILVEKEYYPILLPYFQRFREDYDVVFNNPDNGEMVVRYLTNEDSSVR